MTGKAPDYSKTNTDKLKEMHKKALKREKEIAVMDRDNQARIRRISAELIKRAVNKQ